MENVFRANRYDFQEQYRERNWGIYRMRVIEKRTLDSIGAKYNLSRERVRQIVFKAENLMKFFQKEVLLIAKPRGFHLITREVLNAIPEISNIKVGQLQVFIKHTSASLTINENADPTVRQDFERHFETKTFSEL